MQLSKNIPLELLQLKLHGLQAIYHLHLELLDHSLTVLLTVALFTPSPLKQYIVMCITHPW